MRIGFDAKRALNNTTGLGVYSRNLLNALLEYYPQESYYLFTAKIKEILFSELHGKFQICLPQSHLAKALPALWRSYGISKELSSFEISVYHGLSNELPLGIKRGTKKIVTIHDLIFLKETQQYPFIDRQIYYRKVQYACKAADIIVSISEQTKEDIVRFYGVNESKIKVVYQHCSPLFFKQNTATEKEQIRQKYNLPENFILHVASFFPRKNQYALIQAFARICSEINFDLVLIGGYQSERKKCEQLVQELKLENRVRFLAHVPLNDLPVFYQMASLFVYLSSYEGFGIPVVEAMASNLPVLCSDIPCFREIGKKAFHYVNPSDISQVATRIKELLQKPYNGVYQEDQLHRFKAETFAQQMISIYKD